MDTEPSPLIRFRLDPRTGVAPYRQLVDQVRQAISLGLLHPGDQLPSVREVVSQIPINPNTVHRAYRDLEQAGFTEGRPGIGTFVRASTSSSADPERLEELSLELHGWMERARGAGLDDESISGLVAAAMRAEPDLFRSTQ